MVEEDPKARQLVGLRFCLSVFCFMYALGQQMKQLLRAGSAAGQKQAKKRLGVRTGLPCFPCSWHLLLVHSRRVKGQRGSCSKLRDGLKGLVD